MKYLFWYDLLKNIIQKKCSTVKTIFEVGLDHMISFFSRTDRMKKESYIRFYFHTLMIYFSGKVL